jgi:hypothetical protein
MRCKPRVQQRDQVYRDGHVLGVRLVLERRLTQILVDLPDALSIGAASNRGFPSRSTAGNQRPTTPSASPRPVRGASPPPRPIPPTSNAAAPPTGATDATGRAEHVRKGLPRPDESRFPLVSSARSRPPVT